MDKIFSSMLREFDTCRMTSAVTLWVNSAARTDGEFGHFPRDKTGFADRFAFMTPSGLTFDDLEFDRNRRRTLFAERYGGAGIGGNGGGVRCGNEGRVQIKGVGQNPLVGSGVDIHHAYGGFKAAYAVHEAIYTAVLNKILPVGVADVFGVIATGPLAAFVDGTKRGWGGLLVREAAVRPAHFIRAGHFVPRPEHTMGMLSDVGRVRAANKRLLHECGGVNGFISLMGRFLLNSANQLSYARLARLAHGAVTPSNICLDGRWIDLTNTSFTGASENLAGGNRFSPSFYEEMSLPPQLLVELVDTFSCYNMMKMNTAPFIDYYRDNYDTFYLYHLCAMFGLDYTTLHNHGLDAQVGLLRQAVSAILSSGKPKYDVWPMALADSDPMLVMTECLFAWTHQPVWAERSFPNCATLDKGLIGKLCSGFLEMLRYTHAQNAMGVDFTQYQAILCIGAIKRIMLPELYFKGRLETATDRRLANHDLDAVERMIDCSVQVANWAFDGPDEHGSTAIVETAGLSIGYCSGGAFEVRRGGTVQRFSNAARLLASIADIDWTTRQVADFSFERYVRRLLAALARIDFSSTEPPHARH